MYSPQLPARLDPSLVEVDPRTVDVAIVFPGGVINVERFPTWALVACGIMPSQAITHQTATQLRALIVQAVDAAPNIMEQAADALIYQNRPAFAAPHSAHEGIRFSTPAAGLNPVRTRPGLTSAGAANGDPEPLPSTGRPGLAGVSLAELFVQTPPGETGPAGINAPDMTGFMVNRSPTWNLCSPYVKAMETTFCQIKEKLVPLADFLALLKAAYNWSAADLYALEQLSKGAKRAYERCNEAIYTPDLLLLMANSEDKSIADLAERAKKLRKSSIHQDPTALNFVLGRPAAAQPAAPPFAAAYAAPAYAPAAYPQPDAYQPGAQGRRTASGVFPPGSCSFHPTSTTHTTSHCDAAKRRAAGVSSSASAPPPAPAAGPSRTG